MALGTPTGERSEKRLCPKMGRPENVSFEIYLHIICARGVLGAIISRSNVTYHASCKRVRIKLVVILIISRIVNCHKH
jgi:hypothetical protein